MNKVARATTASLLGRCHLSDGHHEQVAKRRNAFADCEWDICEADDSHVFYETVCAAAAGMTESVNIKALVKSYDFANAFKIQNFGINLLT